MKNLMKKFEECLNTWVDLPGYVYTDEYKNAFIEFIKKKIAIGCSVDSLLVVMTLHHETGDRIPYFTFDRSKNKDIENLYAFLQFTIL